MIYLLTYKDFFTKSFSKIQTNYFTLSIFAVLFSFIQFNCTNKNAVISQEAIEVVFVTKKDANLYSDVIERIVVDEIPAFIKVNAIEKIILLDDSKEKKVYYKTIFNKKEGWVDSIYLAAIKNDSKPLLKAETNENIQTPVTKPKDKIKGKSKEDSSPRKQIKKYYVQIASFKNEVNAKKLFKKIQLDNDLLTLEKVNTSKGLYYRIMTNSYDTEEEASRTLKKIKKENANLSPIIKINSLSVNQKNAQAKIQKKIGKTEYYTVQLSSFEDKVSAEKFAKKMTDLGYQSKVTEAWVKGKVWFRVQHGEYKMIAVAKQVSNKLENKYKFNPWISNIYK
ncbi:MAG: SPOR domain-containing protein [Candidatus Neomarinimicrobiota bacterium]